MGQVWLQQYQYLVNVRSVRDLLVLPLLLSEEVLSPTLVIKVGSSLLAIVVGAPVVGR